MTVALDFIQMQGKDKAPRADLKEQWMQNYLYIIKYNPGFDLLHIMVT